MGLRHKLISAGIAVSLLSGRAAVFARGFDEVFPVIKKEYKETVFTDEGSYAHTMLEDGARDYTPAFIPPKPAADGVNKVLEYNPQMVMEFLAVIPLEKRRTPLDVYNALGMTRALAGREYYSFTRKKKVPLFKTVSRMESKNSAKRAADPPTQKSIPNFEDIYFMVDDVNFGTCYYYSRFINAEPGIMYAIQNSRTISAYFIPVIKAESLNILFYIEPVKEGLLIYAFMGIRLQDLAASHVDIPSAARKRLDVLKGWLIDGVTREQ